MKKLSYSLLALLTLVFVAVGCSKTGNDDSASLLRTVPADASSVVVVNIAHTVESLGGSTDGSTVKLSDDLQKTIDQSQAIKSEDKKQIKEICDGETGVAMSSIVFFSAARSYVTGLLNDPDKFVAYVEKESGSKAVVEGDARTIDNVAVLGNQFWVCTTGRPDVEQLKYYQELGDKQSYVSVDASKLLLEADKVMTYVADVNRSMSLVPNGTYMKMASSLVFNDMAYVAGSADIKKKSFIANASVLNSDMKPAELLLPVEKIDASVVKSFDKNADVFIAAGVPKKLIKKITDLAGSMMGGSQGQALGMLEAIDGTIAVRTNSGANDGEARIQTTGKDFADFSNLLQSAFGVTVTRDGDMITAVYGSKDFSGSITPSEAADMLKGSWIGVVTKGFPARDVTSVTKLSVDNKSLRLDFEAKGGVDALIEAITK
ncbi:MAG: hypothetical protein K2H38_00435 [Muribaculaceae bacterium]|nr:hypothetical protein [Muribaculaceae bacterium]MDE6552564.1 hypothetical protein [Muribaculaceae bacterium]